MIVIRYALSNPQKSELRSSLHGDHKEHIRMAPFQVLMSGPAFYAESKVTDAALLVATVDNFAELEQFNAKDPFVLSGVYSKTWLLEWRPSLGHIDGLIAQLAANHDMQKA